MVVFSPPRNLLPVIFAAMELECNLEPQAHVIPAASRLRAASLHTGVPLCSRSRCQPMPAAIVRCFAGKVLLLVFQHLHHFFKGMYQLYLHGIILTLSY